MTTQLTAKQLQQYRASVRAALAPKKPTKLKPALSFTRLVEAVRLAEKLQHNSPVRVEVTVGSQGVRVVVSRGLMSRNERISWERLSNADTNLLADKVHYAFTGMLRRYS